ncbi:MAG: alpha-amylase/4-alpha-glucanotransferase domain-containing protein, partial [Candidatus Limnocylindrus sp.]
DASERRPDLLRVYPAGTICRAIADGTARAIAPLAESAWVLTAHDDRSATLTTTQQIASTTIAATRTIRLSGGRMDPNLTVETTLSHTGGPALSAVLDEEWNLMLLGGGGNPAAHWTAAGVRTSHDTPGEAPAGAALSSGSDYLGIAVTTITSPHAAAAWAPIETISNSEGGFERVYQGSSLHLTRTIELLPGTTVTVRTEHACGLSRDITAEEGLPS